MLIAVDEQSQAFAPLKALIDQVDAGEDVIFTRHGQTVARLVPVEQTDIATRRMAALERFQRAAAKIITLGPEAARSQDFLYDEDGLPA